MIEKPEFPKPRLIREDFLPYEPMKNYRIKKVTDGNVTRYFPQVKHLFWWHNLIYSPPYTYNNDGGFSTLEEARYAIQKLKKKEKSVEYIYDLD